MGQDADDNISLIVEERGPCATCGEPAYIVRRSGQRLCARCFTAERTQEKRTAAS